MAPILSLSNRQCRHDPSCPDCLHHLRETPGTVGVSLKTTSRIDAMCLSIGSLRNPARTIRRSSDLVSNEFAETTDREQRRLFSGSGLDFMNYLSEPGVTIAMRSILHGSAPYSHHVGYRTFPCQSHD